MHFIRLIRPINLMVILLTMYGVRVYYLCIDGYYPEVQFQNESFDFLMLVISTMMIAAAGNIINDYFDVRADRVNRPEKLIITKYIKPRWAIVSHWSLNFVAFAIACYLSWRYRTFWYVFIHLLSINSLWFYSMYFKRTFFLGNIIIAALTGLVPILCGIHFHQLITKKSSEFSLHLFEWNSPYLFITCFAGFAFSLNLIRELIKDIEDIKGDLMLRAKTVPIVLGVNQTKLIALLLTVSLLAFTTLFGWLAFLKFENVFINWFAPAFIIPALLLWITLSLLRSEEQKRFRKIDLLLKICMIIGTSLPFYWLLLL